MSILYKYRSWNESYHKRIINNQELYFTTPNYFNDPFDSFIRLRFESLKGKSLSSYQEALHQLLIKDPVFSRVQLGEVKKAKSFNDLSKFSRDNLKEMIKNVGIVSLTERFDNILMWSHYAANHKGFCVGFDIDSMATLITGTNLHPVTYQDSYPLITPSPDFVKDLEKQLTTKSSDWKYEAEMRLISNHYINKPFNFQKKHLKEIVFGCKMTKTNKSEILKSIKTQKYTGLDIYNACQSDKEFKINRIRLNPSEIKELMEYKSRKKP